MVDLVKLRKKAKERKESVPDVEQPAPATVKSPVEAAATKPVERPSAEDSATSVSHPPVVAAPTHAAAPESVDSKLDRFKREAGRLRKRLDVAADLPVEEGGNDHLELLTFRLSDESYAVDIENIVELVPPRTTTRVPNSDSTVIGITSLRGTIVTVIDLRLKLGHPPVIQHTGDSRMIVVEHDGETSGFVVDRVSRVIKLDPTRIESHPIVSASEQNEMIRGVFQQPGGLTILLDLQKILG